MIFFCYLIFSNFSFSEDWNKLFVWYDIILQGIKGKIKEIGWIFQGPGEIIEKLVKF